jgi:16S rRNA (cytosine967-C5)-methyltransferase
VATGDATELVAHFGGDAFDAVLVDAPCSGLGTLRRYPEKRWRITPETPRSLHALQAELVRAASRVVRPGGAVVYSTCSIAREENADVIGEFLASDAGSDFTLEPLNEVIPDEWGTFRDGTGCFRSWPRSGGPDGHFVALLRRSER